MQEELVKILIIEVYLIFEKLKINILGWVIKKKRSLIAHSPNSVVIQEKWDLKKFD